MENKCLAYGGSSQFRLLLPYLRKQNILVPYVYDSFIEELSFDFTGIHLKEKDSWKEIISSVTHYLVCIGNEHGKIRHELAKTFRNEYFLKSIEIKHDRSFQCETSSYGLGCMFMVGSILNSYSTLGEDCILNSNAVVDHECQIGNGVHVMGGANIAGRVKIDDFTTIGTNATILPNIQIGKGCYIGAGAVVTKNIPDYEIVVGNPAKRYIKKH